MFASIHRFAVALAAVFVVSVSSTTVHGELVTPIVIDNGGAGYSTIAWSEQGGIADAFNNTQGFNSAANNTGASATYTFSGLTTGQQYRAFKTWRQGGQGNVSTAVPFSVSDGGGAGTINQQSGAGPDRDLVARDTNGAGTLHFEFQHLGTATEDGDGSVAVSVTGPAAGGFSLSDAVILAPVVSNVQVIDNGDAGYSQTGFTLQAAPLSSFDSDQAFNSTPNNGAFATWNFDDLTAGIYEVYAHWDNDGQANLSPVAPFTVSDGLGLVTVNQEIGPDTDMILADTDNANVEFFGFQSLGTVTVTDGSVLVRLDAVAGGGNSDFVFADAVALRTVSVFAPEPSSFLLLIAGIGGLVAARRRRVRS